MRILLAILMAFSLSSASFAAGGGGGGGGGGSSSSGQSNRFLTFFSLSASEEESEEWEEEDDDPRSFTMPSVVAPLSSDGRLTGFAYARVRVRVASGHSIWQVQEKTHFGLDSLIRASHRYPLATANGETLDEERAVAVWLEALRELYGENVIETVEIRGFDVRLLRR